MLEFKKFLNLKNIFFLNFIRIELVEKRLKMQIIYY